MKTRSISLLFFAFITFAGCKVQEPAAIALDLKPGKIYYQHLQMQSAITEELQGQKIDFNINMEAVMKHKVLGVENDVYTLELRYDAMNMEMTSAVGVNIKFDSEAQDSSDIMSRMMGGMIDQPFILKMNNKGKVIEINNLDNLYAHMFDNFPNIDASTKEQYLAQMKEAYGEKAIRGNLELTSAIYPPDDVQLGDHWQIQTKLTALMNATVNADFELKEIGDTFYRVASTADLITDSSEPFAQPNGMALGYDLKGKMTSDIKIDKATGWIISGTFKQSLSGTATSGALAGTSIPMEIHSEIEITDK